MNVTNGGFRVDPIFESNAGDDYEDFCHSAETARSQTSRREQVEMCQDFDSSRLPSSTSPKDSGLNGKMSASSSQKKKNVRLDFDSVGELLCDAKTEDVEGAKSSFSATRLQSLNPPLKQPKSRGPHCSNEEICEMR